MGTQKDIAKKKIKEKGADYVLALKKNQETLYKDVEEYFQFAKTENFKDIEYQFMRTVDKGHGRIEIREYYLISNISWLERRKDWEGIKSIGMVISSRREKTNECKETRYFIASITDGNKFAEAVREHWGIESMHWLLDVTFKEDKSRIRKENEPENTALLRKMALNIDYLEKVMIDDILNN